MLAPKCHKLGCPTLYHPNLVLLVFFLRFPDGTAVVTVGSNNWCHIDTWAWVLVFSFGCRRLWRRKPSIHTVCFLNWWLGLKNFDSTICNDAGPHTDTWLCQDCACKSVVEYHYWWFHSSYTDTTPRHDSCFASSFLDVSSWGRFSFIFFSAFFLTNLISNNKYEVYNYILYF